MNNQNFTTSFTVDKTPEEVFNAINNVRGWWSEEIEGDTNKLDSVFDYHFKYLHRCKIKITELIPGKKVAWHVLENYFSFTKDKTELKFTHVGLVPEYECYNICSDGWGTYINISLKNLITTGKGNPNIGEPITDSEKVLDK